MGGTPSTPGAAPRAPAGPKMPATEAPRVACYSGAGRLVALADTCDGGSRLQPTLVFPDAFDVAS